MADPFAPPASTKNVPHPKRPAKRRRGPRPGGLPHSTMGDYRREITSPGQNPRTMYHSANPQQRAALRAMARKRGVTLQGLLGGGPRTLQESSPRGIRKQALKTIRSAYAPAERELDVNAQKAQNLYDTQQSAETQFQNWLASQRAIQGASAAQADAAVRQQMVQLRTEADARLAASQQQAVGQEQSPGSVGADQYQGQQIGSARESAAAAMAAQEANVLGRQSQGQAQAATMNASVDAAGQNRKSAELQNFNDAMFKVAEGHKQLGLHRAADLEKMVTDLQQREITKAGSNRDFQAVMSELGIKGYTAKTERQKAKQTARNENQKLGDARRQHAIENQLKQLDLSIKSGKLSLDQKKQAETKRHNLAQELNQIKKTNSAGGIGGNFSEGAKNRWGTIVNLSGYDTRPKKVPNLLWEASRAYRNGGKLTYELSQRLMEANIAVPPRYRYKGGGTGPH